MNRQRRDLHGIDIGIWPDVDFNALSDAQRIIFSKRRRAIELYAEGDAVRLIEERTGINRHQLYFLLDRCLKIDADGRVVGFPALLKYQRIAPYTRTAPLGSARAAASGGGLGGAFAFLLEQHPPLAQWLTQKIRKRAVTLHQVSTDGPLKTRLSGLGNLHAGFLTQCRAVGITAAD